jgi:predicted transcriptional regulator
MIKNLEELKAEFNKVYTIKDPYVTKLLQAHYVSFRLPGDPLWLVMTGPPGGLKSELINTFSSCKWIHTISTITANTFVSGAQLGKGKPSSMLLKLSENDPDMKQSGIITFKDLTSLMSETDITKSLVMAQLREIYDGKYDKTYGTGHSVNWKGKVTILAGSTHSIHRMRQQYSGLGERFLIYDLIQPEREEASFKSIANANSGAIANIRIGLTEMTRVYANEIIQIPAEIPEIEPKYIENMVKVAEMATRARSTVNRDFRSPNKDIIDVPPPEMPTRFANGLINLLKSLMIINYNETGKWIILEEDLKIVYKIALDSITPDRRFAMQELSKYTVIQTKALAIKLNRPTSSLRRSVEDLVALEIATRERGSGSDGDRWTIKPKYRDLIHQFEGIENTGEELNDANAESEEDLLDQAMETKEQLKEKELF